MRFFTILFLGMVALGQSEPIPPRVGNKVLRAPVTYVTVDFPAESGLPPSAVKGIVISPDWVATVSASTRFAPHIAGQLPDHAWQDTRSSVELLHIKGVGADIPPLLMGDEAFPPTIRAGESMRIWSSLEWREGTLISSNWNFLTLNLKNPDQLFSGAAVFDNRLNFRGMLIGVVGTALHMPPSVPQQTIFTTEAKVAPASVIIHLLDVARRERGEFPLARRQ